MLKTFIVIMIISPSYRPATVQYEAKYENEAQCLMEAEKASAKLEENAGYRNNFVCIAKND